VTCAKSGLNHGKGCGKVTTDNVPENPPPGQSSLTTEYTRDGICRVLSLDGGGSKGFYTLGVLKEIEAMLNCPLYKRFDLVYGTSTGAIIAALIVLGYEIDQIHEFYKTHVPTIMRAGSATKKSVALNKLANEAFGDRTFEHVKTGVGIVATKWTIERPMIFKGSAAQAHGRKGTFVPGFGVTIADAVTASCSAYPFFIRPTVTTSAGDRVELADGGYCANNPTLYAIADAVRALNVDPVNLRVVSIGVGVYPQPKPTFKARIISKSPAVQLLQKTMEINTQSMEQLRAVLFKDIRTIRISDTFERPEMATDFMEHNLAKLNILRQRGSESFASRESDLREVLAAPKGA
jgi:predicted acylesterase/phospholipase RssA